MLLASATGMLPTWQMCHHGEQLPVLMVLLALKQRRLDQLLLVQPAVLQAVHCISSILRIEWNSHLHGRMRVCHQNIHPDAGCSR
jgi:hypothetical protein